MVCYLYMYRHNYGLVHLAVPHLMFDLILTFFYILSSNLVVILCDWVILSVGNTYIMLLPLLLIFNVLLMYKSNLMITDEHETHFLDVLNVSAWRYFSGRKSLRENVSSLAFKGDLYLRLRRNVFCELWMCPNKILVVQSFERHCNVARKPVCVCSNTAVINKRLLSSSSDKYPY